MCFIRGQGRWEGLDALIVDKLFFSCLCALLQVKLNFRLEVFDVIYQT